MKKLLLVFALLIATSGFAQIKTIDVFNRTLLVGSLTVGSTNQFDILINKEDGAYIPDYGIIKVWGTTKTDDDSIIVYVSGVCNGNLTVDYIDTLTVAIGVGSGGIAVLTPTLSGVAGFPDQIRLAITGENNSAADTNYVSLQLIVESQKGANK